MELENEIKQTKFRSEYHKMVINILFTSKWIESKNMELLKPFKISIQQFNILRILRGQHPKCATMNLLQDRMLDKMSNASRLVEKLRIKGFVDRKIDDDNRRQVRVTITNSGLELLEKIDVIMETQSSIYEKIELDEAKLVNSILDKFRS